MLQSLRKPLEIRLTKAEIRLERIKKRLDRLDEIEMQTNTNLDVIADQCGVKSPAKLRDIWKEYVKVMYKCANYILIYSSTAWISNGTS